jgi:1-phosphofructokinase family hexose kinase
MMVLTVTINPLLERRFYFPDINLKSVNRNAKVSLKAGGKGVNVSRQLNKFKIQNSALIFTGGSNGKLYRESLRGEGINFSDIKIKSETRDAAIIINQKNSEVFSFFGTDALVASSEVDEFLLKLEKMIATCEIVVFSGSSPCKEADTIFSEGIKMVNRLDKISVCDTYGNHLNDCFNASPTIVHNNVDEIKSSLQIELKKDNDFTDLLKQFYNKGIKQAFITNAAEPIYASNFDFHYKVTLPQISAVDSTGSGDTFVAGIIYGWQNKLTFEQQLQFSSALGICNAKSVEVCEVELEDARENVKDIKIESIGKRIKEINDVPG